MKEWIITAITWLAGFLLSRWMLKVEHEAEGNKFTNGDAVAAVIMSLLSFVSVFVMLIQAWAKSVKNYWQEPVKNKKAE